MSDTTNLFATEWTNTALFLIPPFGISDIEMERNGYYNAYLSDVDRDYEEDHIIYTLFRPQNDFIFNQFIDKLEADGFILDDYDYEGGYVVLVLKFPEEFHKDFDLVVAGKYSKCSKKFKDLFPKKKQTFRNGAPYISETIQYRVFNKSKVLRDEVEAIIGELLDYDAEYWSSFDDEKETLDIVKLLEKNG